MLSGTTCALTCPNYYGINTAAPSVCISCGPNCKTCLDYATKCLTCDPSYYILNNGVTSTCVLICPDEYITNSVPAIPVCSACTSPSLKCSVSLTNCTACITTPTVKYLFN